MATTINSTALDFNNIKNNLKTYLANQDQFKDFNFEGAGLSNILDVLAYNTHFNSLVANFALNESYLGTAQLRSSIVSLAESIGYIPDTDTPSQAKIRIFFSTTTTPRDSIIELPAYTQFSTTVDEINYTFLTLEPHLATDDGTGFYEFVTASGSNQIPIFEGTLRTKTFIVGDVADDPLYVIPDRNLNAESVSVNVFESTTGSTSVPYQNIEAATTITSESSVYILKESPNGFFELSFGDGKTFGVAPPAGGRIEVTYLSTAGATADGANTFTAVSTLTTGGSSSITTPLSVITFDESVGGDSKESIESIRKKAPFRYAAQNRMVTAEDYSSLILRNHSTFIKDIVAFGGEEALQPEFGAVVVSILFKDNVSASRKASTKLEILDLAKQLSIVSYSLRFSDPVTTFIELDTFFQFNPKLTDQTLNAIRDGVETEIAKYFDKFTGKFKQSFRRSNLLADIDESSSAVLSTRINVRMQQRFTPTTPTLVDTIENLASVTLTNDQINRIVGLVVAKKIKDAANLMVTNSFTASNFNDVQTTLAGVAVKNSNTLQFPVAIREPDDTEHTVISSQFTFNGQDAILRNKLNSTTIQIVAPIGGEVFLENVGFYEAGLGTVTINFFNPTAIAGGNTFIKVSATPANESAISPTRNNILVYDPNRSITRGVSVSATS